MKRIRWWLRGLSQRVFPRLTLAILANRSWVLEPEVALVPLLSRKNGVAVDAGANKGVYVYHLSRLYRQVHAFEPLPVLAACLKRAVPKNARVQSVALSDRVGTAELKLPRGFNELGSLEAHTSETWTTTAEPLESHIVALITLDSLELKDVDLLKVDVEGHELAVLRGASDTIQRCKPTVLVEVEERHGAGNVANVRAHLEGLGYSGYFLDGAALKPIGDFDLARDQSLSELTRSVKTGRYINNFIYFDRHKAAERIDVIGAALRAKHPGAPGRASAPYQPITARQRLSRLLRPASPTL